MVECWVMKCYKNRLCLALVLMGVLMIVQPVSTSAAVPESWKAEWEQTLSAAKKEGQLTLYGSPDFEGLFGEFHKKYQI